MERALTLARTIHKAIPTRSASERTLNRSERAHEPEAREDTNPKRKREDGNDLPSFPNPIGFPFPPFPLFPNLKRP